jgi:large subunit ribosomal protein L30
MSAAPKRKSKVKTARKAKARAPRKHTVAAKKPAEKPAVIPSHEPPERKEVAERTFLIAIRLKGEFGAPSDIQNLLAGLRLKSKFNAVLLDNDSISKGTLRQAKDYVTYGEIMPRDVATLLKERGELFGGLHLNDKAAQEKFGKQSIDDLVSALAQGDISLKTLWTKGLKPVFRLHPPSGGFEKSTKRPYRSDGELGYRGPEISSLVARMM